MSIQRSILRNFGNDNKKHNFADPFTIYTLFPATIRCSVIRNQSRTGFLTYLIRLDESVVGRKEWSILLCENVSS